MINIFDNLAAADAVIGSSEGKLYYGNLDPIADNITSVPVGSYYLRDFECTLHWKYGPNVGDWIIVNSGSATRSLGAMVRGRHTDDVVLTGNTNSPVPFGVFDISTDPSVVRAPNQHSIDMIENGSYVIQYWFSAIGNPTDVNVELSINDNVVPHNRDIVTGIAVVEDVPQSSSLTIRAKNDTTNTITITEFHCLVLKVDTPIVLDSADSSTPILAKDSTGAMVEVDEIVPGNGIISQVLNGSLELSINENKIHELQKNIAITDGVKTETDLSTLTIGNGLLMAAGPDGNVTLEVDGIQSTQPTTRSVFSAHSSYYSSVSWYTRYINWDIETRKDIERFEHNVGSSNVTVKETGWYAIQYEVSLKISSGSSRTSSRSYIAINGNEISGTESYGYHRSSSQGYDTSSAKVSMYLGKGDTISIRSVRKSGSATLYTQPYASRIFIESVD